MASAAHQLFDPEAPPVRGAGDPTEDGGHAQVLSIGGLYDEVDAALNSAFPRRRQLWVRGEIQSFSDQAGKSGHCYLDLVDPDDAGGSTSRGRGAPALKVKCWKGTWAPLRGSLSREGVTLAEGMVVVLRGTLDIYRPKGEIGFIVSELDVTALLGRLAIKRAELLRSLEAEGLLRRNATLAVPEVPLRIGLVASPGTEGYHDFLGQLTGSGFGFQVRVVPVTVQGNVAPRAIAAAVRQLCASSCDVIAVIRGGGSKADLAAFDAEIVARAIATAPKPVWTGIGHTGDESVADIVANRICITPTECGHQLVLQVSSWWFEHVGSNAAALAARVPSLLEDAQSRDTQARGRLTRAARGQLRVHRERLGLRATTLGRRAPEGLMSRQSVLRAHAARLGPLSLGHAARVDERVRSWRRLLAAYDVDRQLERGYSLTYTSEGRLVRGADGVGVGGELVTRFSNGTVRSRVESNEIDEVQDAATSEEM
ncbi:MAG TPA: exodeoxyribonuclease VII large subunit [Acidimicrobiales bacterium]|jgi:exodeoxyribonuclease VII large subunit|nr:exodeoxyribonuclease VII large subunit [Acidimicrobiales bacterium]